MNTVLAIVLGILVFTFAGLNVYEVKLLLKAKRILINAENTVRNVTYTEQLAIKYLEDARALRNAARVERNLSKKEGA